MNLRVQSPQLDNLAKLWDVLKWTWRLLEKPPSIKCANKCEFKIRASKYKYWLMTYLTRLWDIYIRCHAPKSCDFSKAKAGFCSPPGWTRNWARCLTGLTMVHAVHACRSTSWFCFEPLPPSAAFYGQPRIPPRPPVHLIGQHRSTKLPLVKIRRGGRECTSDHKQSQAHRRQYEWSLLGKNLSSGRCKNSTVFLSGWISAI